MIHRNWWVPRVQKVGGCKGGCRFLVGIRPPDPRTTWVVTSLPSSRSLPGIDRLHQPIHLTLLQGL